MPEFTTVHLAGESLDDLRSVLGRYVSSVSFPSTSMRHDLPGQIEACGCAVHFDGGILVVSAWDMTYSNHLFHSAQHFDIVANQNPPWILKSNLDLCIVRSPDDIRESFLEFPSAEEPSTRGVIERIEIRSLEKSDYHSGKQRFDEMECDAVIVFEWTYGGRFCLSVKEPASDGTFTVANTPAAVSREIAGTTRRLELRFEDP